MNPCLVFIRTQLRILQEEERARNQIGSIPKGLWSNTVVRPLVVGVFVRYSNSRRI